jgi:hypothetical protein
MVMERGQSGLRKMGDNDLADQLAGIQLEYTRRHGKNDIPLKGKLSERPAGEALRLHSSLEGKVRQETITIGGKTSKELLSELTQGGFRVSSYARSIMENPEFTTLPDPEPIDLVRLHIKDLGIKRGYPTTTEVYERALELDLKLCPAEVGPNYRLQNKNQPLGEWFYVGMKPIPDSDGYPYVFLLERDDDGVWLDGSWAEPDDGWGPEDGFVFSLRK